MKINKKCEQEIWRPHRRGGIAAEGFLHGAGVTPGGEQAPQGSCGVSPRGVVYVGDAISTYRE